MCLIESGSFKGLFWKPNDSYSSLTGTSICQEVWGMWWCSAGAIATAQNAALLGRRGQWITCPTSSVCIKSLLGPKAVFGTSPRTPSSSLITALTTPYCHCLSPQPEGQLRGGRHRCIPCSSHSAWLEYKAQSIRLHLIGIRGHQRHLSRKIP